ncbi:MAG: aromatic ring-hydroxylating dioxygenase subunit alpha [Sulfuricellaceae bacterium]|nr:aromatic ring-hydroxylating dioxygenase subunit alpha [Sulfuricellaceae bacterium]
MTRLASLSSAPGAEAPQLPVSWYFDPAVYALEMELLFNRGPGYVGHELLAPAIGDYYVPEWLGNAKALVRSEHGVELLSNVCRHRQAVILKGSGHGTNIVCPLHRWTYDLSGKLIGAPHFPDNPCLNLGKSPLNNWNGLLFSGRRNVAADLARLGVAEDLDFSGYQLDRVTIDEYNINWKCFIEVYLEDYHVEPFHPGLSHFVDCGQLHWEFGERYSVQTVGVNKGLTKAGSPVYVRWQEQVLKYNAGRPPKHGAVWLTYFPNVMVEWYPNTLVVSTIIPRGIDRCTNVVEFYYPEDIVLFERDYVAAEQAAYRETAVEDEDICQRMQDGRAALWAQGIDETGPYQSPTELGMEHFHRFLRAEIEPYL